MQQHISSDTNVILPSEITGWQGIKILADNVERIVASECRTSEPHWRELESLKLGLSLPNGGSPHTTGGANDPCLSAFQ